MPKIRHKSEYKPRTLSRREIEVLEALIFYEGDSLKVAQDLELTLHTINSHRASIFAKTRSHTMGQLFSKCLKQVTAGILKPFGAQVDHVQRTKQA